MAGSVISTPWWIVLFLQTAQDGDGRLDLAPRRAPSGSGASARHPSRCTLRYSSSVVAPMQCSSPRANAGLQHVAGVDRPSALPAPTMVCSSSMNRMICPSSFWLRPPSAPPSGVPRTRRDTCAGQEPPCREQRLPSGFGTSSFRCAVPALDDGPSCRHPGSPISTGLFLVRRCRIWMARRISSSSADDRVELATRRALSEVDAVFSATRADLRLPEVDTRPQRRRWRPPVTRCEAVLGNSPGLVLVVTQGKQGTSRW